MIRGRHQPLAEGLAGDRQAIEIEERPQLAQYRADAAGSEQILHVMRPGRLQIDQHRRLVADRVEPVEVDVDPRAAGDRGQMNHCIGRTADRH